MKHALYSEYLRQKNDIKTEGGQKVRRLSTDVRHRTHNVKELKEKFEQQNKSFNDQPLNPPKGGEGGRRSGGRRSRSNIKRRHTVGGTKDVSKVVALHKALLQWQQLCGEQNQIHQPKGITPETLEELIQPWETRERLGASSPDLPNLLSLLMPSVTSGQEAQHRRLSVREPWPLQPVLESHV